MITGFIFRTSARNARCTHFDKFRSVYAIINIFRPLKLHNGGMSDCNNFHFTLMWVSGSGDGAQYRCVLLVSHIVGHWPAVLAAGARRVGCFFVVVFVCVFFVFFRLVYPIFLF